MPRVSVFMPSYNHAPYVAAAIRSVQTQSYQDFEIVVTDDGSTDGTPDILAGLGETRLRLHRFARNRGAVAATNDAIRRSTGEYLALLNSDDAFLPHKLERQVAFLDANPDIGAVFGLPEFIDQHGARIDTDASNHGRVFEVANRSQSEWLRHFFLTGNCLCHPTIMIRRACYEHVGLYDARFAQLPDLHMWMRLVAAYPIHVLPEPLIGFRELPDGANASSIRRLDSYVRVAWEDVHVRKCYVDLPGPMFDAAFAPELARLPLPLEDDRRLRLGQICIATEDPRLHRLGLELLQEAMPPTIDDGRDMAFSHGDFVQQTGRIDAYNQLDGLRVMRLEAQLQQARANHAVEAVATPVPANPPAWLGLPDAGTPLHLGCGTNILHGWINVDLDPKPGAHYWDARKGEVPLGDGTIRLIFMEHFIEHLTLEQSMRVLRECLRVLAPGGIIRLSTPDLMYAIRAYCQSRLDEWHDVGWRPRTRCDLLNEGMREWGHQYLFDSERLSEFLSEAGFSRVAAVPWHQSSVPELRNLECRPFHGELIFEAQKAAPVFRSLPGFH